MTLQRMLGACPRPSWAAPSPRDGTGGDTQAPASGMSLPCTWSGDAGTEPKGPAGPPGACRSFVGLAALRGRRDSKPGRVPARQRQMTDSDTQHGEGAAWPWKVGAQVCPQPLQGLAQVPDVAPAPHLGGEVTDQLTGPGSGDVNGPATQSPGDRGHRAACCWTSRVLREAADRPTEHAFRGQLELFTGSLANFLMLGVAGAQVADT